MALISDVSYVLHNLRLSHLRASTDSISAGVIDLKEGLAGDGDWIRASGGRDSEKWPELDVVHSPLPTQSTFDSLPSRRPRLNRNASSTSSRKQPSTRAPIPAALQGVPEVGEPGGSQLKYTKTIVGPGRTGGMGMRVDGTRRLARRADASGTPGEGSSSGMTAREEEDSAGEGEVRIQPATASAGVGGGPGGLRALESAAPPSLAFKAGEASHHRRRLRIRTTSQEPNSSSQLSATTQSPSPSPTAKATTSDDPYSPTSPSSFRNPFRPPRPPRTPNSQSHSSGGGTGSFVTSPSLIEGQSSFGESSSPRTPAPRGSNTTITGGHRRRSDSAPLPTVTSPTTSVSTPEVYRPSPGEDETSVSASVSNGASGSLLDEEGEDEDRDVDEDEEFLDDGDEEYDDEDDLGVDERASGVDRLPLGSMLSGGDDDVDASDGEVGIVREEEDLLAGFREDGFIEDQEEEEEEGGDAVVAGSVGSVERGREQVAEGVDRPKRPISSHPPPRSTPSFVFARSKIPTPPLLQTVSSLSLVFQAHNTKAPTPFSTYARIASAQPPTAPALSLSLYFPHSKTPTKPIKTAVRKDSTVEEVVGYGLFLYSEEGREPKLDEGREEEGRERDIRLSTVGWGLRIVEDDGEVDEDFPALDREANAAKFSFLEFAITESTPSQIAQNLQKTPLPSRPTAVANKSASSLAPPPSTVPGSSIQGGSFGGSVSNSYADLSPMVRVGAGGVIVLLKINVVNTADIRFSTTVSVSSMTYLADVLELVCRKKRIPNGPEDWVLCLADLSFILPLDRTVESLMGVTDLALVKRAWAVSHGLKGGNEKGGDPNASVFKDFHQPDQVKMVSAFDSTYKKYTVQRKAPIGRHERILAIDGDYVHVMPSENRTHGFPSSMRTASYHITSILGVKQSRKNPSSFKLLVIKDGNLNKRYEFEGENGRVVSEIVGIIKDLMRLYLPEREQPDNLLMPTSPSKLRRHPAV
ncbi:stress-activated map kinase interacting protein 1-domain-containing protein [Mrakia frigida]|uniref:Avo1p n=1 Tax=Mrakia frigida TaxID=29902 RepID=UPI003FCC0F30